MAVIRPRVVVTHWIHPEVVEYLSGFCDPLVPSGELALWSPPQLRELVRDAEGLIVCMADQVDEDFLVGCPRLRIIAATLKGYDNFDADACARHGVWLSVVPDTIVAPTAELAVGLIIGIVRRIGEGDRLVRSGRFVGWRPELYASSLAGATVGIVGMGALGRAIAERLGVFGARVVYHDRQPLSLIDERELGVVGLDLVQLIEVSTVIVVALPLTPATLGVIDADVLHRVRRGSFLINMGRGSVVDEETVADALDEGRLGGYAADVFAVEDWARPDRPLSISRRLLEHPRTLLTPHLGSAVDDVRRAMSIQAAHQIRQALAGERPDHVVNRRDV